MRPLIALITVFLTLISCSQPKANLLIEQRIHNIENSLVEFSTLMSLFQVDRTKNEDFMTLSDRMEYYNVPGVSIAVINEFALEWAKPYGVLKADSDQPVTTDTFFQAASTSKLVTAAIVLHYCEKGIFNLDEDVNNYLKSWNIPENEWTRRQKVTLRLLLTHQAGLPTTNFPQQENAGDPTLVQVLKGELPAMNKPAIVEYTPGTKWQYSNLGCVVIQQILEDVIGKTYSQIAQETVFEPLGVKNSTFLYPLKKELQAKEAMPHDAERRIGEPALPPTALAHGGLMTTPSDLAIFTVELMRAYKGLSNRLLSKEMTHQMFRKELDLDPSMFGVPLSEGLGMILFGEGEDLVFAHPGSNFPGMNCWLVGYPETGRGAVIMTNGAKGEILAMEIISAINREYSQPIDQ
ncbi:MAG: serine hydrolase domain-containing protein [Candidatus Aminicenantales bacterium]